MSPPSSCSPLLSQVGVGALLARLGLRVGKHEDARLTGVVWVHHLNAPIVFLACLFVGGISVSRAYVIMTRPPGPPCEGVEKCLQTQSGTAILSDVQERISTIDRCQELLKRDCYWDGLGNQPGSLVWSCGALMLVISSLLGLQKRPTGAPKSLYW